MAAHPKPWTEKDIQVLRKMYDNKFTAAIIGERLGRTQGAINSKIKDYVLPIMRKNNEKA